jgi:aldose sugar dehydrogenase
MSSSPRANAFTEEERVYAQDLDKTFGKIVRVATDGTVPEDNPFTNEITAENNIWTLGHRNIQGAAMRQGTGQFWVIEHGPAGGDELNLIEAGANYGWPVVSYGVNYDGSEVGQGLYRHEDEGFVEPVYYWDPVIAPGGMTFYEGEMFADWEGDLLIAALVTGGLVRLEMEGDRVSGEERLVTDLGRVRDVAVDADGSLLVITDLPEGALWRITPSGATSNYSRAARDIRPRSISLNSGLTSGVIAWEDGWCGCWAAGCSPSRLC